MRHMKLLCAGMGLGGILSGYATFILLLEKGKPHPWMFLLGLAGAAFLIESMRELIEPRDHHGEEHGFGSRFSCIIVTLLILAIFELFVAAWDGLPHLVQNKGMLKEVGASVLGPDLSQVVSAWSPCIARKPPKNSTRHATLTKESPSPLGAAMPTSVGHAPASHASSNRESRPPCRQQRWLAE